ncbi:MAG: M28 family peptidase [Lentisphaerota bacterium]
MPISECRMGRVAASVSERWLKGRLSIADFRMPDGKSTRDLWRAKSNQRERAVSGTLMGLALIVSLFLTAGCGQEKTPPPPSQSFNIDPAQFSGDKAFDELKKFLMVGPAVAGTDKALQVAQFLESRLKDLGLKVEIDEFTEISPDGQTVFRNVIARRKGSGKGMVILGSHFDGKSGLPEGFDGANDAGSSTAVLLEMASVISHAPEPPVDMVFAFFDGEECKVHYGPGDGLHGSRHMAKQLKEQGQVGQVRAMILLDMVGDKDLTLTIPRNGTAELISALFEAARKQNVRNKFSLYPFEVGDDHTPFLEAGIPAIDIIDFYYGSATGLNDYWHTAEDRLENVSPQSLEITGKVTLELLNSLLIQSHSVGVLE